MSKDIPINMLICPTCKSEKLEVDKSSLYCRECFTVYPYKNNAYHFIDYTITGKSDSIDALKLHLKKFNSLYSALIFWISPVFIDSHLKRFVKKYIDGKNIIAFSLGSGNSDISENISNVDIFPYRNVNATADISNLPIKTETVDVIISIAVLEHTPHPQKAVAEMHRTLKKGGIVYAFVPYIQGFHASPNDYNRWTLEGLKTLFSDFHLREIRSTGGPTSGLLWILQEWVAILLSFGIKPLYLAILFFLMITTFPLKFIDYFLNRHPMAKNITSGFTIISQKP